MTPFFAALKLSRILNIVIHASQTVFSDLMLLLCIHR